MNESATLRQMPSISPSTAGEHFDDHIPDPRAGAFPSHGPTRKPGTGDPFGFTCRRLRAAARRHVRVPIDAGVAPTRQRDRRPRRRAGLTAPLFGKRIPRALLSPFADAALRRVLEVIDRRRPVAQLRPLLAPALIDTVIELSRSSHIGGRQVEECAHGRQAPPDTAAHGRRRRRLVRPRCSGPTPAGRACVRSPHVSSSTTSAGASSPCRSVDSPPRPRLWWARAGKHHQRGTGHRRAGRADFRVDRRRRKALQVRRLRDRGPFGGASRRR